MTVIEELLAASERYATDFDTGSLAPAPALGLAVLACMDARIDVERLFGLHPGDAHVIRNAGGRVTDDALRSIAVSTNLLGVRDIVVVQHTDCGMVGDDEVLRRKLSEAAGVDASGIDLRAIPDLDRSVREDVARILGSPFAPEDVRVHGYVYDVRTGRLRELVPG